MSYKRILCPVDFSSFCEQAIEVATSIALAEGGKLYLTHVAIPDLPMSAGVPIPDIHLDMTDEKEKLMRMLPSDSSVQFEHIFVRGEPSQKIIDAINENSIDLVVMSTHGRTGLSRLLMGSLAEKIVRLAPCPVLVVKTPEKAHRKAS